jgi:hypothetical protein
MHRTIPTRGRARRRAEALPQVMAQKLAVGRLAQARPASAPSPRPCACRPVHSPRRGRRGWWRPDPTGAIPVSRANSCISVVSGPVSIRDTRSISPDSIAEKDAHCCGDLRLRQAGDLAHQVLALRHGIGPRDAELLRQGLARIAHGRQRDVAAIGRGLQHHRVAGIGQRHARLAVGEEVRQLPVPAGADRGGRVAVRSGRGSR